MNTNTSQPRTLKVECAGDHFYHRTFPRIRLQGVWLAEMGFLPEGRVFILAIAPGIALLKYVEPTTNDECPAAHLNDR